MSRPRVLVGCEFSGIIREEFRKRGWDAWSCDLQDTEIPGQHYQCDIFEVLARGDHWDIFIVHPECTFIAVSGNRWYAGTQARRDGIAFAERLWFWPGLQKLALENPVGVLSTQSRIDVKPQYIQPWQFGHGETKKTGLWLRGLPPLKPTCIVDGREQRIWRMPPGATRHNDRSRTYPGIAAAMADQWGGLQ